MKHGDFISNEKLLKVLYAMGFKGPTCFVYESSAEGSSGIVTYHDLNLHPGATVTLQRIGITLDRKAQDVQEKKFRVAAHMYLDAFRFLNEKFKSVITTDIVTKEGHELYHILTGCMATISELKYGFTFEITQVYDEKERRSMYVVRKLRYCGMKFESKKSEIKALKKTLFWNRYAAMEAAMYLFFTSLNPGLEEDDPAEDYSDIAAPLIEFTDETTQEQATEKQ